MLAGDVAAGRLSGRFAFALALLSWAALIEFHGHRCLVVVLGFSQCETSSLGAFCTRRQVVVVERKKRLTPAVDLKDFIMVFSAHFGHGEVHTRV